MGDKPPQVDPNYHVTPQIFRTGLSDTSTFSSTRTSSGYYTSTNPTPTMVSTSTTSPTIKPTVSSPPFQAGGLSKGAKAGIGVGTAFGVTFLIAVLAVLLFRRWKKGLDEATESGRTEVAQLRGIYGLGTKHELHAEGKKAGGEEIVEHGCSGGMGAAVELEGGR